MNFIETIVSALRSKANELPQPQGSLYTWTPSPVANPNVTTPAAQTNSEGDNVSLQIPASDPNSYPLSYDAMDLPPGLSIDSSSLISGAVAYSTATDFDGSYNPTVIVANQGGSTQTSFSWTINQAQVAPVLTRPGNQSNRTGDSVNLQVSATQVDNDPISYDASNLPDGLSMVVQEIFRTFFHGEPASSPWAVEVRR